MKLERKDWDSEFFNREFFNIEVELGEMLRQETLSEVMSSLPQNRLNVELQLDSRMSEYIPLIEESGFRLVDTKIAFLTDLNLCEQPMPQVPYGVLRRVEGKDFSRIEELTFKCLVDNPAFVSRYKNEQLFTKDESQAYYMAWNNRAFREQPELFAVWEVDGVVQAFFNYMRIEGVYKGVLTGVDESHRGHKIQNQMQYYLFRAFGEERFCVENATQLSNLPVIKNHIKSGRGLTEIRYFFNRIIK